MSLLTDLHAVRALLTPPGAWTQYVCARDESRWPCSPSGPHATCWCVVGAAIAAGVDIAPIEPFDWMALSRFNDTPGRTQAEVLAMLDDAIAKESAS